MLRDRLINTLSIPLMLIKRILVSNIILLRNRTGLLPCGRNSNCSTAMKSNQRKCTRRKTTKPLTWITHLLDMPVLSNTHPGLLSGINKSTRSINIELSLSCDNRNQ